MATIQCPPQEELKYTLNRQKPLFDGQIAVASDITSKWFRDNAYCINTEAIRVCMDSPFGPDIVYEHCEVTDPLTRLGLLVGGIQEVTEEYKPLSIDDEGRLLVDAAISIAEVQLDVEVRALDDDSVGIWGQVDQDTGDIQPINITAAGYIRVTTDGDYDILANPVPASSAIIAHDRNSAHDDTTQNQRITAVPGSGEVVALDVSLHDENGQNYNENNPLPVTLAESENDELHIHEETENLAKRVGVVATSTNHEYEVTDGRALLIYGIMSSGSGKIKTEVKVGDGAATEAFTTKATKFNSTVFTDADFNFYRVPLKIVGTANGTTVRITITNRDLQDQDVYSTIIGVEKDI